MSQLDDTVMCKESLDPISIVCLPIINSILAVMATAENVFVIIAICKVLFLRTTPNQFLCSLAVADLIVGILMNPVIAVKSKMNILGNVHPLSIFTECMSLQTLPATTFSLLAITIDRYIAVTKCFRYTELVTRKRSIYTIAICWMSTLILPAIRLMITDNSWLPHLWAAAILFTFVIPLFVMIYCYFHIWKAAKAQTRRIACQSVAERRRTKSVAKNAKAAWTIGIVIGVTILLWLPSFVIGAVQNATKDDCAKRQMNATWLWGLTVAFSLSSFNPMIYCFRGKEFRNIFRRVFTSKEKEGRLRNTATIRISGLGEKSLPL